jgi:hypothetical protein
LNKKTLRSRTTNTHKNGQAILLHLAASAGNIILGMPLLVVKTQMEFIVGLVIDADCLQIADLWREWMMCLRRN